MREMSISSNSLPVMHDKRAKNQFYTVVSDAEISCSDSPYLPSFRSRRARNESFLPNR